MTETRRVIVEAATDCEPIAGRIEGEREASRPFTGWLELIAALEAELSPRASQETEEA